MALFFVELLKKFGRGQKRPPPPVQIGLKYSFGVVF